MTGDSHTSKRAVVIGGGVIGAMCAWSLSQSGCRVTVVDQDRFGAGCSHGNCGYVSPSHVLPLPGPGAIPGALGSMVRRNSPLKIRMRLSPALWNWLWHFALRCNRRDQMEAATARHALLQSSQQLYKEMIRDHRIDCEWEERGILFVFHSRKEFEAYAETEALLRERFGVAATRLDADALVAREPALLPGLGGAWHYKGDCHLRPDKWMAAMKGLLQSRDVEIVENLKVTGFARDGGRARAVVSESRTLEADSFVVATGALTPFLNRHLGCSIPIQPGKGYSLTMPSPRLAPKIPMIFEEHRVAITPMQSGYRIGSTMEFAGYDTSINPGRLDLLKTSSALYLREPYVEPIEQEWFGWRPMTWDGKPIIDRSPMMENVWIAAGHNMLGISMATGTGRLVSELVAGRPPHVDPAPYALGRFR